ncbi:MAG TPA: hypothetical protein DEB35_02665 [Desulfuromonas sp.]|nr:hypothetical protein [Desulfuromonas sp.]
MTQKFTTTKKCRLKYGDFISRFSETWITSYLVKQQATQDAVGIFLGHGMNLHSAAQNSQIFQT